MHCAGSKNQSVGRSVLAEGVNSSKGAEAQTSKNTGGAQVCEQTAQDGKRAVAGFSALRRKEVRTRIKYAVIYRHRKKYPVSVLCRFFQVSQNEYYMISSIVRADWRKRRPLQKPSRNSESAAFITIPRPSSIPWRSTACLQKSVAAASGGRWGTGPFVFPTGSWPSSGTWQ